MGAKRHLNGGTKEDTNRQTDTQTDIATMTVSAQWADSVKTLASLALSFFLSTKQNQVIVIFI